MLCDRNLSGTGVFLTGIPFSERGVSMMVMRMPAGSRNRIVPVRFVLALLICRTDQRRTRRLA